MRTGRTDFGGLEEEGLVGIGKRGIVVHRVVVIRRRVLGGVKAGAVGNVVRHGCRGLSFGEAGY